MKRKLIISSLITFMTISIGLYFYVSGNNDNEVVLENEETKQVVNTNALTMMYETEVGSGEYTVSSDRNWPQEGYTFNEQLSGCENGGTLSWNNETKRVVLTTSTSDKCYVYFDIYSPVIINNVSTSNITNSSITLTVNATAGENSIQTYYYSNNGGDSYVESNSDNYTFSGLEAGTEYNFRVYVVDSNGISSEVYSLQATTEVYTLANCIKSLYISDGVNGIYLHDGQGTYDSLEAGDNSYRFAGANPNNYMCFGTDITPCPNDNLYRVIGVFGEYVKLVLSKNLRSYAWSANGTNEWSEATLNTEILNGHF